jgi:tripartite-type tricarboxylate transporter receptor subunit TctC
MRQATGQQFLVINKAGGNGRIGLGDLVKSDPDGYTLLVNNDGGIGIPPAVDPTFPFSYKDGYTPIAQAVEAQYLMAVKAGLPTRTLGEFVAYAKANPGKLNYGSSGIASTPHATAAYLASTFKLDMVHVPYQGAAPALNDFLAGVTDLYLPSIASIAGHLTNPSVRFLATLGPKRVSVLPDVPTMSELGVGEMTMVGWLGVFGPPNLPVGLRDQISDLVEQVMRDPEQQVKFRAIFADPVTKSAREFAPFYLAEVEKWKLFGERTGFKVAP